MNGQELSKESAPQEKETQSASSDALATPVYFPVSPVKLIVMSVCTYGIYDIYWFYKNWNLIRDREKLNIMPFWRAFFAFYFTYSLFKKIRMTAQSLNLKRSIAAVPLGAGWMIVTACFELSDPYSLLTYLAVLFLVPVQRLVNEMNESVKPGYEENKRFTPWNIAAVVFGGIFFVVADVVNLLGSFLPAE